MQSRDFTYVDNAVHANLLAARALQPIAGQVINVATGSRISLNQLAVAMAYWRRLLETDGVIDSQRLPKSVTVVVSKATIGR